MNSILKQLNTLGIIPTAVIRNPDCAVPVAKALVDCGVPCIEVQFSNEGAGTVVANMKKTFPDLLVGAGGITTVEQVKEAIAAGAAYIAGCGVNAKVIEYCKQKKLLVIPGCSTASDVELAMEFELDTVKFFPAEAVGGIHTLAALQENYPNVHFIPAGGICGDNLNQYLSVSGVLSCNCKLPDDLLELESGRGVYAYVRALKASLLGFCVWHVGINSANAEEAKATVSLFAKLLDADLAENSASIFAGTGIEVMKTPFRGRYGHIAIRTNDIKRASAYVEANGFMIDWDNVKKDANGNFGAAYFKEEIGGFAVHLLQKK